MTRAHRPAPAPAPVLALLASASILVLVLVLAPAPAAADPIPLSSLPAKPVRYAQAKGPVPATITPDQGNFAISASGDPLVCVTLGSPKYWIDGDTVIDGHWTDLVTGPLSPFTIERLAIRGDTAELERIAAVVRYRGIEPTARSRISLLPVAKLDTLVVYAYRWASQVYLVTRSTGTTTMRSDGRTGLASGSECGVVYTQLVVRHGSSQVAQIRGTVPATGKPFLVDASISQTSRDPEPLLSVTARLLDR